MDMDSVFAQFAGYDWDSDQAYKDALHDVLALRLEAIQEQDPLATAVPSHEQDILAWQTKLYVFCSSTGHILSLDEFWAWQKLNKIVEVTLESDPVKGNAENHTASDENAENIGNNEAPYSSNYQNLVDLIINGKPVPGIKEIPKTVLEGQGLTLTASARPKPWEMNQESE